MNERIINFLRWLWEKKSEGGICLYEGEFHATVTDGQGHILCSGIGKTPDAALDEIINGFNKVGGI